MTSNSFSSEFGTSSSHFEEDQVIRIQQSSGLSGNVRVSGAKNSVLKIMAASLLAPGKYVINNVPHIAEVEINPETGFIVDLRHLKNIVEMTDETDLKDQAACAGGACEIV